MSRELTKQQTRAALLAAATAEFAEHGLDASLDAICARAGFTRGAFYVHFKDRDDLLVAVVEQTLSQFQDAMLPPGDADIERAIARYIAQAALGVGVTAGTPAWRFRHTLAACARVPALRERYVALQRNAILRLDATISAAQRARKLRRDIDAHALAEILVTLTLGIAATRDVGLPVDLAAGAAALTRLLAAPRRRR